MIIDCIKCTKKFKVNASLIPANGRTIQCGSCNHIWFYKPEIELSKNESKTEISSPKSNNYVLENKKDDFTNEKLSKAVETNNLEKFANTEPSSNKLINENKKKPQKNLNYSKKETSALVKYDKKQNFTIGKFLSYLIVMIVSFVALLIVIDTFKKPFKRF